MRRNASRCPRLESWTEARITGSPLLFGIGHLFNEPVTLRPLGSNPAVDCNLSLGDVRDLAEVFVNGQPLGVVWKPPYRVDASSALHAGVNRIEVRVTNEWTNRILGDRAAPPDERVLTGVQAGFGPRPAAAGSCRDCWGLFEFSQKSECMLRF